MELQGFFVHRNRIPAGPHWIGYFDAVSLLCAAILRDEGLWLQVAPGGQKKPDFGANSIVCVCLSCGDQSTC